jgi:hypothetical protein
VERRTLLIAKGIGNVTWAEAIHTIEEFSLTDCPVVLVQRSATMALTV